MIRPGPLLRLSVVAVSMTAVSLMQPAQAATHYHDTLIGERASSMGGAFAAIADDPSGAFYNPAGLAFSFESYLSLSANVFLNSTLTFKDIAPGKDYKLRSSALSPAYFGFSQSYGAYKFAFSIIVPNSVLYDQEDQLQDFSAENKKPNSLFRKFFVKDTTYLAGPSLAREIRQNFSLGLSAFVHYRNVKSINDQVVSYNPVPGAYKIENAYFQDTDVGFVPELGAQYMPIPKWSIGLVVSRPVHISSKTKARLIGTTTNDAGFPNQQTGSFDNDVKAQVRTGSIGVTENITATLGNAYFFSKRFLMAADLSYYSADAVTNVKATYNWSVGAEYFVSDFLPVRLGLYSNNSNEKAVRDPDVDLIGVTTGLSWLTPSSSFSLGLSMAQGTGRGNVLGNDIYQVVKQLDWSLAIMGSYQL